MEYGSRDKPERKSGRAGFVDARLEGAGVPGISLGTGSRRDNGASPAYSNTYRSAGPSTSSATRRLTKRPQGASIGVL